MKKFFIVVSAMAFLSGCGGNKNQEEKASVDEFSQIAKNMKDTHNAQNSLDYKGVYTGKVPTASGEGVVVSVTLEDSTYLRVIEYMDKKDSKFEEKGKYTWNSEGNTVTLEGIKDSPNKYFVGENILIQLDMDGNRITGENANMYILKK